MEWTRSNTLALASQKCAQCHGIGLREGRFSNPCDCVLRHIFRLCYERFKQFAQAEKRINGVSWEIHSGPNRRGTWGLKEEEFVADFLAIARRTLDEREHRIFRYHFLLGADFQLCIRKLGGDRGNFFHAVYRIQRKLGRTFAELEPYALFPLAEYFHGAHRNEPVKPTAGIDRRITPIRPPAALRPTRKAA